MQHDVAGEWWTDDGDPVSGVLRHGSDAARLTLLRPLVPDERPDLFSTVELIHGVDGERTRYTLVGNRLDGTARRSDGADHQTWSPSAVLVRQHLTTDDLHFDRMLVRSIHLDEFAERPQVEIDESRDDDNWPNRIVATAERRVLLSGRLPGASCALVAGATHSGGGIKTTVGYDVKWDVQPDGPMTWEGLLDGPAGLLIDLVSFSLSLPSAVESISLRSKTRTARGDSEWVDLQLPYRRPAAQRRGIGAHATERLVTIRDAPRDLIDRWAQLAADLGPVRTLMLAPAAAPFVYNEHRFIMLAQAAEALHDRLYETSRELPKDEHRARVEAVLASDLPQEHRSWVGEVLRRANSVSFTTKMVRVLGNCPPIAHGLDVDGVAAQIASGRNPLSHGDLHRARTPTAVRRHWLSEVLRFAISWHMLVRLMGDHEASTRIGNHRVLLHALDEVQRSDD